MKKRLLVLVALFVVAMSAMVGTAQVILGPFVSPFWNIYGSPLWNSQWTESRSDLINGTFVNMQNAQDPRFVGLVPILMLPSDESVYSFGDLGQRIHFPLALAGSLAQWQGNVQFKSSVLWDGVYWTTVGGAWVIDDPSLGFGNSTLEYSGGFSIAKSGFAWWSAYGYTSDTPEARAALSADEDSYWLYQTDGDKPGLIGQYRWRADASSPWVYLPAIEVRIMPQLAYGLMDPFALGPTEATALYDGGLFDLVSALAGFGIPFENVVERAIQYGLPTVEKWLERLQYEANFDLIQEVMDKFGVKQDYALWLQREFGAQWLKLGWERKDNLEDLQAYLMGYVVKWNGDAIFTEGENGQLLSSFQLFHPVTGEQVLEPYLFPYLNMVATSQDGQITMVLAGEYSYLPFAFDPASGTYSLVFNPAGMETGAYIVFAAFRTLGNDADPARQTFYVE